jgi:hypothetical protein
MTSWAVPILVFGYIVELAISPALPIANSPFQTCTVIVECLQQPVVLHTNSFLHRAVVIVLKNELKFLGHLHTVLPRRNAVKYGVSQNPGFVELAIHAGIDTIPGFYEPVRSRRLQKSTKRI